MIEKEKSRKKLTKTFRKILDSPGVTETQVNEFLGYWSILGEGYTNGDYGYLLSAIDRKLKSMEESFRNHPIAEDDWRSARDIRICRALIPIATGNESVTRTNKPYVNLKNLKKFIGIKRAEQILNIDEPFIQSWSAREEKAWHLLFRIFTDRMRYWWN